MLDPAMVHWICKLLAEGLSHREVARITGVSHGRIVLIAHSVDPDCTAWRGEQSEEKERRLSREARRAQMHRTLPPDGFQNPLRLERKENRHRRGGDSS